MQSTNLEEPSRRQRNENSDYAVVLPCAPKDFSKFVAGLLGRPQTIGRHFSGVFDINADDVETAFHFLDQRVQQQNDANLIQFTVNILYDDDSSVLLDSLDDFKHYREIRQITSVAAHLTWIYLIQFRDKAVPEKQEINLTFSTDRNRIMFVRHSLPHILASGLSTQGDIDLSIRHTARTWGVDIESLLTNHVQSLMKEEPKLKKLIWDNSGVVGLVVGAGTQALAFAGAYIAQGRYLDRQVAAAQAIVSSGATASDFVNRLNFLIDRLVTGQWGRYSLLSGAYLTGSFLLSLILGTWVAVAAGNPPRSFLVLSKRAAENRSEMLVKRHHRWYHLLLAFLVSIIAGIASNVAFTWFSSQYGR